MESQPVTLITAIDKLDDAKELLQKAQWIDMKLIESTGREFTSQDFSDYQKGRETSHRENIFNWIHGNGDIRLQMEMILDYMDHSAMAMNELEKMLNTWKTTTMEH